MNTTSTLYRANGSAAAVRPANGQRFTDKELRALVGGSYRVAVLGSGAALVVSVDAAAEEQPTNVRATEIVRQSGAADSVAGDALVCPPKMLVQQKIKN
jgi:hypothetical protein